MIDNSLTKLLEDIEPKVQDIEENRVELKDLKSVQSTMEELIESAKESCQEIINFYDQDFIMRAIKIKNSNYNDVIKKYNSSKYLLKINDSKLKELPQYLDALDFMDFLYKYLYDLYESINLDYKIKREKLEVQELLNKYYIILNKDEIYVKDIDEFLTFIELNKVSDEDRINIYKKIIECNAKQYFKSLEIKFDNGIGVSNIENLLKENYELLNKNYIERDDLKLKLDDYLKNIIHIDENYMNNRAIYLIHKIKNNYDLKQYAETIDYYKEFNEIKSIQEEFLKQKKVPRKLLFVMENGVSLVRKFLNNTEEKYKNCVYKNLLDIENDNVITIPNKKYRNMYLYIKEEYVVKTIYTFLNDGKVLIIGVLDKDENINDFLEHNYNFLNNINTNETEDERNLLLGNIKIEDLMLNIDLETLDIKREDKNAR